MMLASLQTWKQWKLKDIQAEKVAQRRKATKSKREKKVLREQTPNALGTTISI
jgi:hypothetical protein